MIYNKKICKAVIHLSFFLIYSVLLYVQQLAFPSVEDCGKDALGDRGDKKIEVKKLNVGDSSKVCGIIDSQVDVCGWTKLNNANPPIYSAHNKILDIWEVMNGLNPGNSNDRNIMA